MMRTCVKCGTVRSTTYMQQAVFLNFVGNEPVDVWKCGSANACRKNRKERRGDVSQDSDVVQASP